MLRTISLYVLYILLGTSCSKTKSLNSIHPCVIMHVFSHFFLPLYIQLDLLSSQWLFIQICVNVFFLIGVMYRVIYIILSAVLFIRFFFSCANVFTRFSVFPVSHWINITVLLLFYLPAVSCLVHNVWFETLSLATEYLKNAGFSCFFCCTLSSLQRQTSQ